MFLYNLNYQWNLNNATPPHGMILHAAGCPADKADTRLLPPSQEDFTLFDPDSYLWGLHPGDCRRAVDNLKSYPWVANRELVDLASLPDDAASDLVERAAEWQVGRGATRIILPTPLLDESEGALDNFLRWMDIGIEVASGLDRGALLAVGISESALGPTFDRLLDQITSRPDLPGVYAFVETSASSRSVAVSHSVAHALLEASYFVGTRLKRPVVVNYADAFGLACLAVGALAFGAGYEAKGRRLDFEKFEQRGGGGAYPRLFSLGTTTYLRVRDVESMRDRRLLWMLTRERTDSTGPLLDAMKTGRAAKAVPEWAESRNNVASARSHLTERLRSASDEITGEESLSDRATWTLDWLQNCERDVSYLNDRFDDAPLDDDGRHAKVWRTAFEVFADKYKLLQG